MGLTSAFHPRDVPKGRFLIGHLAEFRRRPLETMAAWHRELGDLVRFRLGPRTFYLVSHPALAEEVLLEKSDVFVKVYDPARPTGLALVLGEGLLTATGETWRRHRRLIQPMFHRARLPSLVGRMVEVAERVIDRWDTHGPNEPIDVASEMMRATLEIITRTMAQTTVLEHIGTLEPMLRVLLRFAFNAFHNPFRLPLWIPTADNRTFRRATAVLDGMIYGLIEARRRDGVRHDDVLDLLLYGQSEEGGPGLTDRQIRDELVTIFSAGHETTANGLAWTWYLLARHAEIARKVTAEVRSVLGEEPPSAEALGRLDYTRAVFEEALRLYPPAPAVQRRAAVDTTLGGHPVRAGTIVVVGIYNIHHHPAWWPDPEGFKPERFLSMPARSSPRLAYLPFGAGPRSCIGSHFAMLEAVLLLALIARRYTLALVPGHPVEPEVAITLRPRHGIKMTIQRVS
ncbi:cytochrome P450 [Candidatus Nitrospira bockiana]